MPEVKLKICIKISVAVKITYKSIYFNLRYHIPKCEMLCGWPSFTNLYNMIHFWSYNCHVEHMIDSSFLLLKWLYKCMEDTVEPHIRPPRDRAIVRTLTHIPWGCLIQNHFFHKGLLRTLVNIVSLLLKINKSTLPKDTTNHTVLWHRIRWKKSAPIRNISIHTKWYPVHIIKRGLLESFCSSFDQQLSPCCSVLCVHPKWYATHLEIP